MSAVTSRSLATPSLGEITQQLTFSKKLQLLTNRVHSAANIDEIITELSREVTAVFEADRLTIYSLSEDNTSIVSKVKMGLNSFKDIKLPINESSLAGFCAYHKRYMNIRDVYDDGELKTYAPTLTFLKAVDQRTGYRSKQMLLAPILAQDGTNDLLGVIQLINTLSGNPFSPPHDEGAVELARTLAIAFRNRQKGATVAGGMSIKSKYDYLIKDNVIAYAELELATRTARRKNASLEDILVDEFQVKPAALGAALGKFYACDYEPHRSDRVKPMDLLKNLKREYCESNQWLPLEDAKNGLIVMGTDPEHLRGSRMVENIFPRAKPIYKVTSAREFKLTLNLFFGEEAGSVTELLSTLDDDGEGIVDAGTDELSAAADNETVKLVNKIITDAYAQGASDIHVEPQPGKGRLGVRFRKDGTLVNYIEIPGSYRSAIVARLKIMCDLDISEKRKPQDGKIKFKKFGPLDIELRVATIPTAGGVEDVVMRILAGGEPIPLEKLGLSNINRDRLKEQISKPYGLFFVCGPTGSGKTTTLHSVLGYLNTPETKIWTAEDPVEITQKGLRQVQVNPKAGFTFAAAMKAFLRADPDIIMVGEMRDAETTHTGIEASLTGHLVFATLHTNSAPESIIRLLDMGMDPFNFSDALLGVLAQRLAKRLCKECKQAYTPSGDEIKQLITEYSEELKHSPEYKADPVAGAKKIFDEWSRDFANDKGQFTMYKAVGCDVCGGTGYKGRVGLHELLIGSDQVKKLIQERARVADIFVSAVGDGMRTLKMDGIEKVVQGITDMAQVRAVCIK
jgi:type II secretory ATPase GspE/PulE/Tfp pilus assembly ATPase PilB-like protein